ncbi:MAG: phospho-sugar mutase [Chitinivibrionales bacterium]|nr:phospho-sugar mutase [Chitinivibrionales bacterium]
METIERLKSIEEALAAYLEHEQHGDFVADAQKSLDELDAQYCQQLEFGTGGLRGVMGAGLNRMNPYVIRRASQGLANYINKAGETNKPSVVIAYDSRLYSDTFANEAASVFCGNGLTTYLFTALRPTPELSFAVRYLKATAGIVITASHNPSRYNGYKVYWSDGAQIVPPHDAGIIAEVNAVGDDIKYLTLEQARAQELLVDIDEKVDSAYINVLKSQALRPELISKEASKLKVVYTPLHGAGRMPLEHALKSLGIEAITVAEQAAPDGRFPTVEYPNPEEASAMKLALELGAHRGADLIMGTDPDADRLGIAIAVDSGFQLITGNQLGALLADYVFSAHAELGTMPSKPAFVKTIVTTELQRLIAEKYGAQCYDTLTGFKYIGEKIREFEAQDDGPQYLFGGEESYGYLVGTSVRDKDAVSAATMTVEMLVYHHSRGKSLIDRLNEIYAEFGYYEEALVSQYFEGPSGLSIMQNMLQDLRDNPPQTFGGEKITTIRDYADGMVRDMQSGKTHQAINLPRSNVLQLVSENDSIISVRPSGTEPKIKFYASCCSPAGSALPEARTLVAERINAIKKEIQQKIELARSRS